MSVIYLIVSFLVNFFTEIMAIQLLFCLLFERRRYWFISLILWGLTDFAFFLIPDFYSIDGFLAVGWLNFSFAVAFIISSLFFFSAVKIKVKEAVFYSSATYAAQNFIHNISYILNDLIGLELREGPWYIVTLGVMLFVLAGVYFLIVRRIRAGEISAVNTSSVLIISVITITLTYVLSMKFLPNSSSDNVARFYAAVCCLFLLFFQFSVFDKGRVQTEKEIVENLLYTQKKQYDTWKENVDIINVKCHDLKHRINVARKTDDSAERSASLKEVEKAIMIYDNFAKTDNETLDIILTEKCLLCEKNNIKFSYMVDGEKLKFLSDEDICALFGNILDNAIEGALKVEDSENRIISLKVFAEGNMLTIHQDNTCISTLRIENGEVKTSKKDARFHGFGVKSMQMTVDKYGGSMRMGAKDGEFNLDIIFFGV